MSNIARARAVIEALARQGVGEFCICAGSRNSPMLAVLGAATGTRLFSFVDERAAAFFAVGRMKLQGRPVAVVTTSGTAAAELLPAAVEAYYSKLPLVLVTADRPPRFRGSGAPQCIEQEGLFGVYAATGLETWTRRGPLHLNLEFDEPLIDQPPAKWELPAGGADRHDGDVRILEDIPFERPLVIVGGLDPSDHDRVRRFAIALGRPVHAEPLSGLREDGDLAPLLIRAGERSLRELDFDGVVRIGDVPVLRFWRDLEERDRGVPVVHFTNAFKGMMRGDLWPVAALPATPAPRSGDDGFLRRDRELRARLDALIAEEPDSEVAMLRRLSEDLPEGTRIYLGNSLPVREWDLAATHDARGFTLAASRGANGIDGQVSTFLGQCDPARHNVCVVGDLTAIYDLNAGWILPQLDPAVTFTIYVVNNGGGRIFSRVGSLRAMEAGVRERIVENAHDFGFEHWAAMWRLPFGDAAAPRGVVELKPDLAASNRFWASHDALWSASR